MHSADDLTLPPPSLLLATDLGARCDRAMERAIDLALQWQCRLVVLCVVPTEQTLDLLDGSSAAQLQTWAHRQIQRDVGARLSPLTLSVRVETAAHTGPCILAVAEQENSQLLVTGMASDALFEQPRIGSTVAWLARHARVPLLVVRNRAHGPYRSMSLACDFSPHCAHALQQALALFGEPLQLDLVHALEMPRTGLLTSTLDSQLEQATRIAASQARQFLADCALPDPLHLRAQVVIQPGQPGQVVGKHVRANDSELVVVGSHGRSALSQMLLGSQAQRLLEGAQCDTLLVHRASDACTES